MIYLIGSTVINVLFVLVGLVGFFQLRDKKNKIIQLSAALALLEEAHKELSRSELEALGKAHMAGETNAELISDIDAMRAEANRLLNELITARDECDNLKSERAALSFTIEQLQKKRNISQLEASIGAAIKKGFHAIRMPNGDIEYFKDPRVMIDSVKVQSSRHDKCEVCGDRAWPRPVKPGEWRSLCSDACIDAYYYPQCENCGCRFPSYNLYRIASSPRTKLCSKECGDEMESKL